MLTLTFVPTGSTPANGVLLCNTSRSLTEMNVKFNHKRITNVENLAIQVGNGQAAYARDFANWRNTLSLTVRRSQNFAGTAFADEEAAFAFTLQQPTSFPTAGILQIALVGTVTNTTLWLLNCVVETITLNDRLGVAPSFNYNFNGGIITNVSPF